ncbi:MAG: metallopeptidase family protein [Phycisphaerales bacterium]|nr:metallopeptidase family protein [Phycisphaerales bacterium]
MTDSERERFDALLEDCLAALPPKIRELIDEVPIVVLDRPPPEMIKELQADGTLEPGEDPDELCGLHSGVAITDRSIEDPGGWGLLNEHGAGPEQIHLFRVGIIDLAGGWDDPNADDAVYEEIRITVLHEIGHHFGLDEDDLEQLGYA